MTQQREKIAVVGLGYVGLPLAVEFGKRFQVVGFDIKPERIEALRQGRDETLESCEELAVADKLSFVSDVAASADCNVYILTVPTPIDSSKRPNLRPILGASETVGSVLKPGDTVIYESTVYPGCTEEDCVPILERMSGLVFNRDFAVGYSPERINPGAREHRLPTVRKVVSGSTPRSRRAHRSALRHDHHSRHLSRRKHQGGRGSQSDREHPARPEHRADQ